MKSLFRFWPVALIIALMWASTQLPQPTPTSSSSTTVAATPTPNSGGQDGVTIIPFDQQQVVTTPVASQPVSQAQSSAVVVTPQPAPPAPPPNCSVKPENPKVYDGILAVSCFETQPQDRFSPEIYNPYCQNGAVMIPFSSKYAGAGINIVLNFKGNDDGSGWQKQDGNDPPAVELPTNVKSHTFNNIQPYKQYEVWANLSDNARVWHQSAKVWFWCPSAQVVAPAAPAPAVVVNPPAEPPPAVTATPSPKIWNVSEVTIAQNLNWIDLTNSEQYVLGVIGSAKDTTARVAGPGWAVSIFKDRNMATISIQSETASGVVKNQTRTSTFADLPGWALKVQLIDRGEETLVFVAPNSTGGWKMLVRQH